MLLLPSTCWIFRNWVAMNRKCLITFVVTQQNGFLSREIKASKSDTGAEDLVKSHGPYNRGMSS